MWIAFSWQSSIKWVVVPKPSFTKHIGSAVSREFFKPVFSQKLCLNLLSIEFIYAHQKGHGYKKMVLSHG